MVKISDLSVENTPRCWAFTPSNGSRMWVFCVISWEQTWGASKNHGNNNLQISKCLLKIIVLGKTLGMWVVLVSEKLDKGTPNPSKLEIFSNENQPFQVGCWASPYWDIPTTCTLPLGIWLYDLSVPKPKLDSQHYQIYV